MKYKKFVLVGSVAVLFVYTLSLTKIGKKTIIALMRQHYLANSDRCMKTSKCEWKMHLNHLYYLHYVNQYADPNGNEYEYFKQLTGIELHANSDFGGLYYEQLDVSIQEIERWREAHWQELKKIREDVRGAP